MVNLIPTLIFKDLFLAIVENKIGFMRVLMGVVEARENSLKL